MEKGEEVQNPERSAQAIRVVALNVVRAATQKEVVPRTNIWMRPSSGQLVLNTYASFIEDNYSGSCGAVIQDGAGFFIAASTAKLEHVGDVESAEAAALLEGLTLARSVGGNSIVARADNITIVDAMANNNGHSMVAGPILDDCRQICADFG